MKLTWTAENGSGIYTARGTRLRYRIGPTAGCWALEVSALDDNNRWEIISTGLHGAKAWAQDIALIWEQNTATHLEAAA